MAITDDLRKTLSDPKPLYFAAGTADLAWKQALRVPSLVEQLRNEAPARIEAVRNTDPKAVQEKAAARAKEAQETLQARVNDLIGSLDTDLKKLGESAQDLALRGVGVAAEYAVRAREAYEKVAEQGEQAVRTWRGDAAEEIEDLAIAVEPEPAPKSQDKPRPVQSVKPVVKPAEPVRVEDDKPSATAPKPAARKAATPANSANSAASANPAKKGPARKAAPARKTTPPAK
ncbi:heparin binding hemagglutinin HbhA [Streptomyces sp. B3I7]|uniref:hypothetical protein n=1 Tax=Streptomyces sp. B3I7 TaxID=3042269 RepID=UPI00277D2324|nr:hypothetical protein [Streptomyces sp. B3I7]MDQ0812640.1 heparin binding hemagglutinin HbhA [Streptomyces sp. B3I7]